MNERVRVLRRLVKAAGLVFELAAIDFDEGTIPTLTAEYVESMVANGDFSRIDEQEDEG